jgi:hypothetical protein
VWDLTRRTTGATRFRRPTKADDMPSPNIGGLFHIFIMFRMTCVTLVFSYSHLGASLICVARRVIHVTAEQRTRAPGGGGARSPEGIAAESNGIGECRRQRHGRTSVYVAWGTRAVVARREPPARF